MDRIIGLTGTLGAGKGTVADYLKRKGFRYTSCSDFLRRELARLKKEETIANLKALGDSLRNQYGTGYIPEQLLKEIKGPTIVDSLRHPGEINVLKKNPHFILIGVNAPIDLRYERVQLRKRSGDNLSFAEFQHQEQLQWEGEGGSIQLKKSIELADYLIDNSQTIEHVYQQVDQILSQIFI